MYITKSRSGRTLREDSPVPLLLVMLLEPWFPSWFPRQVLTTSTVMYENSIKSDEEECWKKYFITYLISTVWVILNHKKFLIVHVNIFFLSDSYKEQLNPITWTFFKIKVMEKDWLGCISLYRRFCNINLHTVEVRKVWNNCVFTMV